MAFQSIDILRSLKNDHKTVLFATAFACGKIPENKLVKFVTEYTSLKETSVRNAIDWLARSGFIFTGIYWWRYEDLSIDNSYAYQALYLLITESPDIYARWRNTSLGRSREARKVLDVVEDAFLHHKPAPKDSLPDDWALSLAVNLVHPDFFPLMSSYVQSNDMSLNLDITFDACIRHDNPDIHGFIPRAMEMLQLNSEEIIHFNARRRLLDYYSFGKYDESQIGSSEYDYILRGVRCCHLERWTEALEHLEKALKMGNKYRGIKNVFDNCLDNYFLILAYIREGSEKSKLKLAQFARKDLSGLTAFLKAFALSFSGPSPEFRESMLWVEETYAPFPKYVSFLYHSYFEEKFPPAAKVTKAPNLMAYRLELSRYVDCGDEDFGGCKPLLASLKKKAKWEYALESLSESLSNGNAEFSASQDSRLAYVINRPGIDLRIQTRLKSGGWGKGKALSWSKYLGPALDCMDERDITIKNKLAGSRSCYLPLDETLPYLINCDRVFCGTYDLYPVNVYEEKPYMLMEKRKDGFVVSSNVDPSFLGNGDCMVHKRSDSEYVVIKVNPMQKKCIESLLSVKKFPFDAEKALRTVMESVGKVISLSSEIGGSSLREIDGNSRLIVRLTPVSGESYNSEVICRPAEGGSMVFTAGVGNAKYVDMVNGEKVLVNRHLRKESNELGRFSSWKKQNSVNGDVFDIKNVLALLEYVRSNESAYSIEWPEGGKIKVGGVTSFGMGLSHGENWFELEGDVTVDEDTVMSISSFLEKVSESRGLEYVRLSDKDYIRLDAKLRSQLEQLDSLMVKQTGKAFVSKYQAGAVKQLMDGGLDIQSDGSVEDLHGKIQEAMAMNPDIPAALNAELRPYQREGYQWMVRMTSWGAGVCLADDMGLGKTVQTIALMLHRADLGPSMVVAPASVVLNWSRELARFAPSLNVTVLNSALDRSDAITNAGASDVILTSYTLTVYTKDIIVDKHWNVVCLDEAHTIKNKNTKMSETAMHLTADAKVILTGTPVQNNVGELWNLFNFINPSMLGSYGFFSEKFVDGEMSESLRSLIKPFILRRTKADVVNDLPEKEETIVPVELSAEEMAVYESIRRKAEAVIEEEEKVNVNVLSMITKLRQAACAPSLAENAWTGGCTKIDVAMDLVSEISLSGHGLLIFSQFTSFLSIMKEALGSAGLKYLSLDGSVPMSKRQSLVEKFQKGECKIFLISLKAGGLGLNLTGASYVIHLDPWWNPAIESQATDRAYRIGQKNNVTVYHLISQNTIEEKILRLHDLKRSVADDILAGTDTSSKLTAADLLALVSASK